MPPESPTVPDLPLASDLPGWLGRMFGHGDLPPPRFSFRMCTETGPSASLRGIEWAVRGFEFSEQVGEPYSLELRVLASAMEVDVDTLLGARIELQIDRGDHARSVLGVVLAAELSGTHGQGARVGLRVGPAMALLGLSRCSRVFQGRSVPQIIETMMGPVLTEYGGVLDTSTLTTSYPPRDYCVQYRETDLDFVLRVLAAEGISLLFHHEGEAETVVLVDANEALAPAGFEPLVERRDEDPPLLPLLADRADDVPVESLRSAAQTSQEVRRQWKSVTWDWKNRPTTRHRTKLAAEGGNTSHGGWWDVDEHRADEGEGTDGPIEDGTVRRVRSLAQGDQGQAVILRATSNATMLRAGSVFELASGPNHEGFGDVWVVTSIRHHAELPHASLHGSASDSRHEYANEIECQPLATALRPVAGPRPRAHGIHSAVVTGPKGAAIHTDRFGRIQVRMLWDEAERDTEPTSCWLRVAQPWAGDGFGTVFIPRVGNEVLVSFIDGDPDRPLCTASVYDGAAMPPYELPEHRSRTVLRTASLDGEGYNELSFEDGDGREEVLLHAHRNLRETVRAAHSTTVGGSQRLAVGGSRTTTVGKDDDATVTGDHHQTVDGDVDLKFRSGLRMHVAASPKPTATKGVGIVVDEGLYTLDVAEGIELRCGECSLRISPDTITLSGPKIIAKSTGPHSREQTTLSLLGGRSELRSDQVYLGTGASQLLLDDRVMLGQGPTGAAEASLDLRRGEATLTAKASATVSSGAIALDTDGPTSITAKELRISAAEVHAKATATIELDAVHEVRVRGGNAIHLN